MRAVILFSWRALAHNYLRFLLLGSAIFFALFLFLTLQGFIELVRIEQNAANALRLFVINRSSQTSPLPLAHYDRLKEVEGVEAVTYGAFFSGFQGSEDRQVAAYAVDPDTFFDVYTDWTSDSLDEWAAERRGAIVGKWLALRSGWSKGDRIVISSPATRQADGSTEWEFIVSGIYDVEEEPSRTTLLLFHYDYFDELRRTDQGTVGAYLVKVPDDGDPVAVGRAIDAIFENSPFETRTMSESALAIDQVRRIGEIGLIVNAVVGAAFFALLISSASIMTQSMRERWREFLTLRAIGFTLPHLSVCLLVQTQFLFLGALAAAIVAAIVCVPAIEQLVGIRTAPLAAVPMTVALAIVFGIVAAIFPILQAARTDLTKALKAV